MNRLIDRWGASQSHWPIGKVCYPMQACSESIPPPCRLGSIPNSRGKRFCRGKSLGRPRNLQTCTEMALDRPPHPHGCPTFRRRLPGLSPLDSFPGFAGFLERTTINRATRRSKIEESELRIRMARRVNMYSWTGRLEWNAGPHDTYQ